MNERTESKYVLINNPAYTSTAIENWLEGMMILKYIYLIYSYYGCLTDKYFLCVHVYTYLAIGIYMQYFNLIFFKFDS